MTSWHPLFQSNPTSWTLQLSHATSCIPRNELDDLIKSSVDQFLSSKNWSQFVESACNPIGDWDKDMADINHSAAKLLSFYKEEGVPVVPTPESVPWSQG